jgi:GT2 family glycosyltransferase
MTENRSIPSRTVIVCAYTLERWVLTERCLQAVLDQEPRADQVVAVIDHNPELAELMAARFPTVSVVANAGSPGLSAARNTGIDHARGDLVAFIDDDAEPAPGWLARLSASFADDSILVAGGRAIAAWETGQPSWFPDEFLWVVGCSYRGQPVSGEVRNPLGCNMAFRRSVFARVGGFDLTVGRVGTLPIGGEETELCLRIRRLIPDGRMILVEGADVHHFVPASRARFGYFIRRCFHEGVSKAVLRGLADEGALSTERDYVRTTLTGAVGRRLRRIATLDRPLASIAGIVAVGLGLAAASFGYALGRLRTRRRRAAAAVAIPTDSTTSAT